MYAWLNLAQSLALSDYLRPTEPDESAEPQQYPVALTIEKHGEFTQVVANGTYLHWDGEWASFPQTDRPPTT